eukprot:scaffold30783_cov48-Phaeocystis_antarctica.AAC.1
MAMPKPNSSPDPVPQPKPKPPTRCGGALGAAVSPPTCVAQVFGSDFLSLSLSLSLSLALTLAQTLTLTLTQVFEYVATNMRGCIRRLAPDV